MISQNNNPVVYVLNSEMVTFNNLKYKDSADVLLLLQGERTKDIKLLNTNTMAAKQRLVANFGAKESIVSWEKPRVMEVQTKKEKEKKISR